MVRGPQHPYTKALLSVVPQRDPRQRSAPQILQGETGQLANGQLAQRAAEVREQQQAEQAARLSTAVVY